MRKLKTGCAYIIKWDDAISASRWRDIEDAKEFNIAPGRTFGVLVFANRRRVVMAASVSGKQVSDIIAIPTGCITGVHYLGVVIKNGKSKC